MTPPAPALRILLVENHADTVKYLRLYLEEKGHAVTVAGTSADALAALASAPTDLIISDIGLPDGNGWELLRSVAMPRPYAVAISGFGTSRDVERSRDAGFEHHLAKPFLPADLEPLLRAASDRRANPHDVIAPTSGRHAPADPSVMNNLTIKGNWNELKGRLKQKYGELTDDDLAFTEGKEEELLGRLQVRLGKGKDEVRKLISDL